VRLLHLVPSVDPQGGGVIEGVRRIHDALAAMGHTGDIVSLDSPEAPCVSAYPGPVVATGPSVSSYGYNERLLRCTVRARPTSSTATACWTRGSSAATRSST
jgi:hypothetical protein